MSAAVVLTFMLLGIAGALLRTLDTLVRRGGFWFVNAIWLATFAVALAHRFWATRKTA